MKRPKKNPSARQYISRMHKNPAKYKTTTGHLESIDKMIKEANEQLKENINRSETRQKSRELKIGLHIRANGRLGIITEIGELIKVKFPTGYESEYQKEKITFCRDAKKAKKQFDEDVARRLKK